MVTLNRPEKLNAIDQEARKNLEEIWKEIAQSDAIRVVVLTGAGEKAFCAGTDLNSVPAQTSAAANNFLNSGQVSLAVAMDIPQPIICAVNGLAFGGGMELVLASDIVIAARHAEFALTEARLGSIPGSGGTQFLPRITSRSNALLYLLTGDRMSAEEAYRLGVVSRLCAPDGLMAEARDIAERIAGNAPLSVAAIKRLVSRGGSIPLEQALMLERYAFGLIAGSEDRAEGRAAFREKRKPNFKGK